MQESPGAFDIPAEARPNNSAAKPGSKTHWYLLRFALILLIVPLVRFNSFMATDSDRDQALQLETTIHARMASGDFNGIYDDADQSLKDKISRDRHNEHFSFIASRYGAPRDCEQNDTGVRFGFGSKMIQSKCLTNFSHGYTAVETFKWKKTGDLYRLYYYHIKAQKSTQ
jgi:hypothetical protein